jgi:uncharacterized protein
MELSSIIKKVEQALKNCSIPLPRAPWVCFMTWRNLFFASWPTPAELVRPKVHPRLELDTFDGTAWVTMVAMEATDVHYRGVPPIPGLNSFRELNLRTYVKVNGRPGVTFLSIECSAAVVDWMSIHFFGIPYFRARVVGIEQDHRLRIATERTQAGKPPAAFWGSFRAFGETSSSSSGSLEGFLLERYSSFFVQNDTIYHGEIRHPQWLLQKAEADIDFNSIPHAVGLALPEKPFHTAFVSRTDTLVWLPARAK